MKEALTPEKVVEYKLNPIEWVKYYKPEWSEEEADFYIWEFTCFPFSFETTLKQLNHQLNK